MISDIRTKHTFRPVTNRIRIMKIQLRPDTECFPHRPDTVFCDVHAQIHFGATEQQSLPDGVTVLGFPSAEITDVGDSVHIQHPRRKILGCKAADLAVIHTPIIDGADLQIGNAGYTPSRLYKNGR